MRVYRNEMSAKKVMNEMNSYIGKIIFKDQLRTAAPSSSASTIGTIYRTAANVDLKPIIVPASSTAGTITIGGIPQVTTSSGQPMQIIMQPGQLPMQILEEQIH